MESIESICKVDFQTLTVDDTKKYEFADLEVTYAFYNIYGKMIGFGIRSYKVRRSKDNNVL